MGFWTDLLGTTSTSFKIGKSKATLDASGLTAARTLTVPDKAGTLACTSDITGTNSGTNTGDETGARIATLNHAASAKTTLVDGDEVTGQDSAASFGLIRTTWTNVKSFLKTYFDTLYYSLTGPSASFRNFVHNGNMQVQQRGSAGVAATNAYQYGCCDRHLVKIAGGTSISGNINRIAASASTSGWMFGVDTASWTTGNFTFQHRMEALNVSGINGVTGKTVTVSCIVFQNTGGTRNWKIDIGKPTTTADTFSAQTVLQTSAAIPSLTGVVTQISASFTLGGADANLGLFVTVYDSDAANTVSGKIYCFGELQVELGSVRTSYEIKPYQVDLADCQRYYFRIKASDTASNSGGAGIGFGQSTTAGRAWITFPKQMRIGPTALEQSGTATDYRVIMAVAGSVTCSAVPVFSNASVFAGDISWTVAASAVAGDSCFFNFNASGGYLGWSADL